MAIFGAWLALSKRPDNSINNCVVHVPLQARWWHYYQLVRTGFAFKTKTDDVKGTFGSGALLKVSMAVLAKSG